LLAVGKAYLDLLRSLVDVICSMAVGWRRALPPFLLPTLPTLLRLHRLAVPLWIVEVLVRFYKVVDREVVLVIEQARAAPDDLLELDHGSDRPQQYDVANVACVHAGRQLLRRSQDRWNSLLLVLKRPQPLLAQRTVVSRHANAVVRIAALLHLIDQVANQRRMALRSAEHERLLALIDLVHEQLDPIAFALLDLDGPIELRLAIAAALFDLPFDDLVVGCVDIIVDRGGELLDLERGQVPVVDAILQGIDVDRVTEVPVGVDVV